MPKTTKVKKKATKVKAKVTKPKTKTVAEIDRDKLEKKFSKKKDKLN